MNSIISNDNLGTTKNWKFLRDDLLSIFAADDARLLENHNEEQIEELFDKLAEDYLDDWAVSGFCIDKEDNVYDVLELIMALSSASILNRHPFRWESESHPRDSFLDNDDFKYAPPSVFMIDTSNAGENYTKDFIKTLDTYFTIMGYGHMDIVYENRLVYINKCKYAAKVKDTADIKDSISSDKYVVKFDPYSFSLFTDSIDLVKRMIYGILIDELEIAKCSNTTTPWKLIYTGNKQFDDEVFSFITSMGDRFKNEVLVSRMYASGSGTGLHHPILEVTASNNDDDNTKPLEVTFAYRFEQNLKSIHE